MADKEMAQPRLNVILFKWQREARLLRQQAKNYDMVGDWQKHDICKAKAIAIEQMVDDLLPLTGDTGEHGPSPESSISPS